MIIFGDKKVTKNVVLCHYFELRISSKIILIFVTSNFVTSFFKLCNFEPMQLATLESEMSEIWEEENNLFEWKTQSCTRNVISQNNTICNMGS